MRYRLFLDVETGGLDPMHYDLLTVGYALVDYGATALQLPREERLVLQREIALRPSGVFGVAYRTSPEALAINGIVLAEHAQDAICPEDAAVLLRTDLLPYGCEITAVGWNIAFDLAFLHEHLLNRTEWDRIVHHRPVDLLSALMFLQPELRGSLHSVAKQLDCPWRPAHRALSDALTTWDVCDAFSAWLDARLGRRSETPS